MKRFFGLCLVLSILPLFSCAARLNGSLAADGSASLSVSMALEPRMTALIRRLSAAGGQTAGQADRPILDGPAIANSMSKTPGVASVSLKNSSPSAVDGQLSVSNVMNLTASDSGRFIAFEQGASGGRCVISINRGNGSAILNLISPEVSGFLNALMAPIATGEELSKAEYLEIVSSFYSKAVGDEIAASRIRASLDFPGTVKSAKGGTFSGKRANFDIPLIDLLVLETPLVYEVNWN